MQARDLMRWREPIELGGDAGDSTNLGALPHEPEHGGHITHQGVVALEDAGTGASGVGEPVPVPGYEAWQPAGIEHSLEGPARNWGSLPFHGPHLPWPGHITSGLSLEHGPGWRQGSAVRGQGQGVPHLSSGGPVHFQANLPPCPAMGPGRSQDLAPLRGQEQKSWPSGVEAVGDK